MASSILYARELSRTCVPAVSLLASFVVSLLYYASYWLWCPNAARLEGLKVIVSSLDQGNAALLQVLFM